MKEIEAYLAGLEWTKDDFPVGAEYWVNPAGTLEVDLASVRGGWELYRIMNDGLIWSTHITYGADLEELQAALREIGS